MRQRKTYEVVVLGSTKCGKSAFLKRLLDNSFSENYVPTVEECRNQDYRFKGFNLNLDFIDTSGPFLFPAMRDFNIKRADVILLLYETNNLPSLKEASKCLEKIYQLRVDNSVPIVLVGTKTDLNKNKNISDVTKNTSDGMFNNIHHIVTSSRNNMNIKDALELALDQIIQKIHTMSLSANYFDPSTGHKKHCCTIS